MLREAGITYPEYVTELTYLIFLKMAHETGSETGLPRGFRWTDLSTRPPSEQFEFYKSLLKKLKSDTKGRVQEIFSEAETTLRNGKYLSLLVKEFDQIDWYAAREESVLADLYEGLLEKNSTESKAGAGQYFTPRPLIDSIVEVMKPKAGEIIQDPAAGTCGFLIAADRYIKHHSNGMKDFSAAQVKFQREKAFVGIELVPETHKLALMNAMLHGIYGPIINGDTLGDKGESVSHADLILTNPPFGSKKGAGLPSRKFPIPTTNKQLAFLQHIYLSLLPGGRAAVVMPDLGNAAANICTDLMDKCVLHTVLRLPPGIFYAFNVKTNVFFFTKGIRKTNNTKETWFYDLRTNMPQFGKRTPLTREHFLDFEKAYGSDPNGNLKREDKGESGRFRRFTREQIRKKGDNLDVLWLTDKSLYTTQTEKSADVLADQIKTRLLSALAELDAMKREIVA